MSKLTKLALILAIAALAIAAKQVAMPGDRKPVSPPAPAASISTDELMRSAGPMTQTPVESHF